MATTSVESSNVVGYKDEAFNGEYRLQSVQFVPVGGYEEDFNINDVLDLSLVADFADELQVYDPESGDFISYYWDTASWADVLTDEPVDISVIPGAAYLCLAEAWRFAGEVPAEVCDISVTPGEYCVVGGALPINATLANFNWLPMADYQDELHLYDSESGDFIAYYWDGANWLDMLSDEPLDFDTASPGFMLLTGQETIREAVAEFAYGE